MLLGQLMLPKVIRFMGLSPNAGDEFDQNVRTTLPAPLRANIASGSVVD